MKYILIYFAVISLLSVILTIHDKSAARKGKKRISERSLFLLSILGGSVAMFAMMRIIRHKTKHKRFMLGIPLIIILQAVFIVFVCDSRLSVSHIDIETDKINEQIKLALVTDLHSCHYGNNQDKLVKAIDSENPDVILLCGDIFDDGLPSDNAEEFIKNVSGKYPCYYVSGNHEFWSNKADDFKTILELYGVNVLEGTSEILEISDDIIRISGIDDPDTDGYPSRSVSHSEQISRLQNNSVDDELFTVLLSHRPERIGELLPLHPDIVLSGHAHGGQWRLPVLLENGLLSPNQGLFPKYTNGEYNFDNTSLIVSRGLARESTRLVPRIFNRPEIVVITLT